MISSKYSLRGKIWRLRLYYVLSTRGGGGAVEGQEENNSRAQSLIGCLFSALMERYPFRIHGRYQSYIFIVGVPRTYLLVSSFIVAFARARARLFPTRLGRTFSGYLFFLFSAHLHHLRRVDFILRKTVFAKRICVGGYYVLDVSRRRHGFSARREGTRVSYFIL